MNHLIDILLISLFCNGWYMITHGGMLLEPLRKLFLELTGGVDKADGTVNYKHPCTGNDSKWKMLYKPLFGCIICYSSIWGTLIYWVLNPFTQEALIYWPITCIICSYTNLFLYNLLMKLE